MRARVEEARAADDTPALRSACASLARWLASRDRGLDEAVELATLALSWGDDVELRRELAAWLESLGESARAATALKPLASVADVEAPEAAYALVRTGVLKARAGIASGAAAAFEAAASVDPSDALAPELLGALFSWESSVVSQATAAQAYVEAARRRAIQQQEDAELEDLWRAFAVHRASDAVAGALATALEQRGRSSAADETWRAHARALAQIDRDGAGRVFARQRALALTAQDFPRALGAALDADLDQVLEGEAGAALDALLLQVGFLEAVAARLEWRADDARKPADRAKHFVQLARLCAGPLADSCRAAACYAAALAANPASEEALVGLRGILGEAERSLASASSDRHTDRAHAWIATLAEVADERERFARLISELGHLLPGGSLTIRPPDDGSDSRAAAALAWVRASFAGDPAARALALERLAVTASPPLAAVLLAIAADRYLAVGDPKAARQAAEGATRADPGSARCVTSLADAVLFDRDRSAAAALERAITLVGPRPEWCFAIAETLAALGEGALAVGWSQRCVALRPGDADAIEGLVSRLLSTGDAARLGDALAWILSQPQPVTMVAAPFARALGELARLDPDRAAVVARRTLDVFGPKLAPLREAMLEVASRASDGAFTAAIWERWLSCGAEGADRRGLFADLADLRSRLGDEEAEARVVVRAIREGVSSPEIDAHLERLAERPATPDAQLWRLEGQAERLAAGNDAEGAAQAWRELGAALWDLADDRVRAIAAWQRAAHVAPSRGHVTLALDLVAFSDVAFAFDYLGRLIDTEPDDATAAMIAADVARAALSLGEARVAFDMGARGVARDASCARALEIAERAAGAAGEQLALSAVYELVASRALGRFGRRAAHYRGARFFERCGQHRLALKHAAQAFYAVPTEGSSFQLLARAAERAGDRTQAVQTVEQVAELTARPDARAAWLLRAASIAGAGEEGARRKVDVLLRAVVCSPAVAAIALLRDASRELLGFGPEEREVLEMRLGRAVRTITERVGGPDGARVALAFGKTLLDLFGDSAGAWLCIERAFGCDADVDEFADLIPRAAALGLVKGARERVTSLLAAAEKSYANVGIAALRLFRAVAAAMGDTALGARAAVAAAVRDPDDDAMVIEADAAARGAPDLAERLAKRVSRPRRAEALLAAARAHVAEGAHGDAAALFERAIDLLEGTARAEAERQLRVSWDAVGRGAEIEARVQKEASSDVALPGTRADRWMEIADRREARDDATGAVRAVTEACKLDPEPLERWSALERVAEIAGDDAVRIRALEEIVRRVGADGRVAVFKRLATAHERRNDAAAAERSWEHVLSLDPEDDDADHAIESVIVARGRYDELADHLARRAQRLTAQPGKQEVLRAVRLRRAAILEQRLGRAEDACDELERLLAEWPDNPGALRYLADLLDRRAEYARSAPLWRRAAAVEPDPVERDELELRAGRASRGAGDLPAALQHASAVLARRSTSRPALELRVDVARILGEDAALGDALDACSGAEGLDAVTRSDLLVEAAQAAARAGDPSRALDRARRAAAHSPERATPQLLARGLEYRVRGPGGPDEARRTLEDLSCIREALGSDDAALCAFLLAEALDAAQGGGAGFQELEAVRARLGDHPLIALGRAERLVVLGQPEAAVEAYRVALGGQLLDLRRPGNVALAAADVAITANRAQDAAYFLDLAERDEVVRGEVPARRARLAQRETLRPARIAAGEDRRVEDLEAAVRAATTPGERARARLALGRVRFDQGDPRGAEPLLWEALADGLAEAGDVLASLLAAEPGRVRDLVRARRQQVGIQPGDVGRLESLYAAALGDDDRVYGRAVEHVLRAFDRGAGPLPPPSLATQPEQPGILALLTRPSLDGLGEALASLWEGAAQIFARDAASYGITGVERVVPGPTSPIARLYEISMRALDAPRIPLFLTRSSSGPPVAHVALLSPPSVILTCAAHDDSAQLSFALGRGMSAALAPNVLRLGLPPGEGRSLVEALHAAFGPPEIGRRIDARTARLAESFWQMVPARTQRRLQQLLGSGSYATYEDLVASAHQSGRRVGMFLAGDFAIAAGTVLAESGLTEETASLDRLASLCEAVPMLADLLRLAVSPEYADARWHVVAPTSRRGTMTSSRFNLF